jgi:hypothetical protein
LLANRATVYRFAESEKEMGRNKQLYWRKWKRIRFRVRWVALGYMVNGLQILQWSAHPPSLQEQIGSWSKMVIFRNSRRLCPLFLDLSRYWMEDWLNGRGANLGSYWINGGERRRRMGRSVLVTTVGRRRVVLHRAAMLASSFFWRHGLLPVSRISSSGQSALTAQVAGTRVRMGKGAAAVLGCLYLMQPAYQLVPSLFQANRQYSSTLND